MFVGHSLVEVIVVEARSVERVGDSVSQHCFSAHVDFCVVHSGKISELCKGLSLLHCPKSAVEPTMKQG